VKFTTAIGSARLKSRLIGRLVGRGGSRESKDRGIDKPSGTRGESNGGEKTSPKRMLKGKTEKCGREDQWVRAVLKRF